MRTIDYNKLLDNLEEIIGALEFDSMRSAGKMKVNSSNLVDLYALRERYTAAAQPKKTAAKPNTPKKEG